MRHLKQFYSLASAKPLGCQRRSRAKHPSESEVAPIPGPVSPSS